MHRLALIALGLAFLSACASQGPLYRGAPPPGYTDAQYRAKLLGTAPADDTRNTYRDSKGDTSGGAKL